MYFVCLFVSAGGQHYGQKFEVGGSRTPPRWKCIILANSKMPKIIIIMKIISIKVYKFYEKIFSSRIHEKLKNFLKAVAKFVIII